MPLSSIEHPLQRPAPPRMVEAQVEDPARGTWRGGGDAEEGALALAVPPGADLLPGCVDLLHAVDLPLPDEARGLAAPVAERHPDRLLDAVAHAHAPARLPTAAFSSLVSMVNRIACA